ncbi:MAG: thioredoxin family protein [Acidobacteriota bacterium]
MRPLLLAATAAFLAAPLSAAAQQATTATGQQTEAPPAAALQQMYDAGVGFDAFLAAARRRREMWRDNFDKSDPANDFVARAQALQGRYHILAVAIDSCSDSVNTIPYIARLVQRVDGLDLQIVDPDQGRLLMDLYRTPDDRGATPTVVILDDGYEVVGAWIERPSALQDWWLGHPEISINEKARRKQGWYDWDEGYSTYAEIVALLEAADARR